LRDVLINVIQNKRDTQEEEERERGNKVGEQKEGEVKGEYGWEERHGGKREEADTYKVNIMRRRRGRARDIGMELQKGSETRKVEGWKGFIVRSREDEDRREI
jgi:hypothetical protein